MVCEDVPSIEWFTNDNPYTECSGSFHYIAIPAVKGETIPVKIWNGGFCYEKSTDDIVSERAFPMTKSGRDDMIEYIRKESALYIHEDDENIEPSN